MTTFYLDEAMMELSKVKTTKERELILSKIQYEKDFIKNCEHRTKWCDIINKLNNDHLSTRGYKACYDYYSSQYSYNRAKEVLRNCTIENSSYLGGIKREFEGYKKDYENKKDAWQFYKKQILEIMK